MKIQVSRERLASAVSAVSAIVKGNSNLEVLNMIKMDIDDSGMHLTGANHEGQISTFVECDVNDLGEPLSMVVDPKKMLSGIRGIKDELITLLIDVKENNVKLTFKYINGQLSMVGDNESIFPDITINEDMIDAEINNGHLLFAFKNSLSFVANDDLRPVLGGVNISHVGKETNIAATDGHKLMHHKISNDSQGNEYNIVLPNELVKVLSQYIPSDDDTTTIQIGQNSINVDIAGLNIKYRIIEGNYPNYNSVIPKESASRLSVEADVLMDAVKRVSVFSNSASRAVVLDISNDSINITGEDIDYGTDAKEMIKLDSSDTTMKIAFNSDNILNILNVMKGERIDMFFNDPSKATVIRKVGDLDTVLLLMPVMI